MHPLKSIRRVALGAALAGAAIGAVPALASAASTCSYLGSARAVDVFDGSGTLPLRIVNANGLVTIKDGPNGPSIFCGGSDNIANVGNTDSISVFGPVSTNVDGVVLDRSGGPLPPVTTFTNTSRPALTVIGNGNDDHIRVAGSGVIDADGDSDFDLRAFEGANFVTLNGNGGQDLLSGQGFLGIGSTTVRLFLNGGPNSDQLIGGFAQDQFNGGSEGDVFHAIGGSQDVIFGGPGFDVANADKIDRFSDVVEQRNIDPIGQLRLRPRVLKAEAGRTARLKMSWKHPQSWRELRKLKLGLYRGKKAVGMINARPASGRLTGDGMVDLIAGSKLGHHGKWVTAKLAMRLPKSLAGEDLRVDVRAIDKQGHKQLERHAGAIRVAN